MQSATTFAVASLAMLLLGSSAALAQPYGYRPYGYGPYGSYGPTPGYCGPHTSQMTNWILDPATGQPITEAQYMARYPWTNTGTWTYDCNTGLWTDNTSQGGYYQGPGYYPQAQNYDPYRGYYRDRERERERDRGDRDRDND